MQNLKLTLLFLLLAVPFFLTAQDYLGSWNMAGVAPDGTKVTNTVTMNPDGTMTVDFGSDGTIEVRSTYSVSDGVVSMTDSSKESPCHGMTGKYRLVISGNTMTAKLIEDPCDARRSDQIVMQRKQ